MRLFPQIQSPCPYKGKLADIMQGDMCRLCHREVHDITAMSNEQRMALVMGCEDEICVSYKVSARSAIAAMALGAAAVASPALAQSADAPVPQADVAVAEEAYYDDPIIVGGLRAPKQAKWLKDEPAAKQPALPVIVEEGRPPRKARKSR